MSTGMRVRSGGFTLIELLVVLTVLSILALAALPLAEVTQKRVKEHELKAALLEIRAALDAYKQAYDTGHITQRSGASGYPPSLQSLVDGVEDAKQANHPLQYFLRRIPRDPFAERDTDLDKMWGLRSYASPPDKPLPGEDVYDVYSRSPGVGLNGIAYREW